MFEGAKAMMQRRFGKRSRKSGRGLLQRSHNVARLWARRLRSRAYTRVNDTLIDFDHLLEMHPGFGEQPLGGASTVGHAAGDFFERGGIGRKRVRLPVVGELKTMFQVAQELVRCGKSTLFRIRQKTLVLKTRDGEEGAAVAHPGVGAAIETLQALDHELNVADAAAVQLYVEFPRSA